MASNMSALRPIIPPHLLVQISKSANVSNRVQHGALNTLNRMAALRAVHRDTFTLKPKEANGIVGHTAAAAPTARHSGHHRAVYDCKHKAGLPIDINGDGVFDTVAGIPPFHGKLLLDEGHVFTGTEDVKARVLYENLKRVYDFYKVVFNRDSVDDHGMKLVACVHYDDDSVPGFFNSLWFHKLAVFGDGDGEVFRSFGDFLDFTAHELTHGVIQSTADLKYENQAGALNESLADVFASMVKQWSKVPKQKAREADWLIGRGLFRVADARALRDMANPGTAYGTNRIFMRDPQPRDMDGYVELFPPDDNPITGNDSGGVHLYSGIPNRAFYLVATTLGGYSWEKAGKIWYNAMCDDELQLVNPRTAFKSFADLTVKHARGFGSVAVTAVTQAWKAVKVYS